MKRASDARLAGWPLVGWCALLLVTMAAAILALRGTGEAGWRTLTRTTAETSFVLFLSAFTASALAHLWPSPPTRWMLRNRRYLGVSFAVSHAIHLVAIVSLAGALGDQFRLDPVTLIFGGTAYLFIAAMTATSFDRSAAWLGPHAWKRLHRIGAHYVWFIFALQYVGLLTRSFWYAPFIAAVLAAMGLRVAAWLSSRRLVVRSAPASIR